MLLIQRKRQGGWPYRANKITRPAYTKVERKRTLNLKSLNQPSVIVVLSLKHVGQIRNSLSDWTDLFTDWRGLLWPWSLLIAYP